MKLMKALGPSNIKITRFYILEPSARRNYFDKELKHSQLRVTPDDI